MAVREILTYPNSRLAIPSEPVTEFNQELEELVADLFETMYDAPGIGLAAPQVDVHKNIFVIDIEYEEDEETGKRINESPMVFINPKFLEKDGEILYKEGCLSVPGIYEEVKRAETIKLEYQDVTGKVHVAEFTDLLAVAIQHENDHLLGRLFIDRLSFVKSRSIKKKIKRDAGI